MSETQALEREGHLRERLPLDGNRPVTKSSPT